MKKIVVSALFGGHDYLKDPVLDGYNPEWEYHLFTDDETLTSEYWVIHVLQGNQEVARQIKINTHKFIPFGVCIWIDASMVLKSDPENILSEMADNDFLFKIHPKRNTVTQEIEACFKLGKLDTHQMQNVIDLCAKTKYTEKEQSKYMLFETGLYCKRNSSKAIDFCENWFKMTKITAYRDQLSLPICLFTNPIPYSFFGDGEYLSYVQISAHSNNYNLLENVRYISPFAIDGNLGAAYNEAGEGLEDEDWLCIHDQDICFLDSRLKLWISMCIFDNPEYDILTCVTNRLADDQQIVFKSMYNQRDICVHKQATEKAHKLYGTKVVEATKPTAGLFMLMRKGVLDTIKFKNGLMYLDTDFYTRALECGLKVGIMKGIYLFHYYRMNEGKSNINHLQRIKFE